MRLSKVAKELNVGIANIVDHLASKGVNIDGRPNTKITPDAYEILKQQFSADVEQHKRSTEVAQARREEKQAIKDAALKKLDQTVKVVKAKADIKPPKTVGKIEVLHKPNLKAQNDTTKSTLQSFKLENKSEEEIDVDEITLSQNLDEEVPPSAKKNDVIKAKGSTNLSGPKKVGKIDINKPVHIDVDAKEVIKKEQKSTGQDEDQKKSLEGKVSDNIRTQVNRSSYRFRSI